MDLTDFRNDLMNDVRARAAQENIGAEEEYINTYTEQLKESEEISDFIPVYYQGIYLRKSIMKINGYNYDELEECLEIFNCPVSNSVSMDSLTPTDADRYFKQSERFLQASFDGFILKNAEESTPGYGLAYDLQNRYKNHIKKIRIYIITDCVMSNRIREIAGSVLNGIPVEYHIWDISRLQALIESVDGKEEIVIDLKNFGVGKGIPCLKASQNNEYTAYLCNIPGIVLAQLYNKYGGRLLEGNVRSFLTARGKVNKGIRNTILKEPSMFFAYNNGIAATAYDIELLHEPDGLYITKIDSLQIVNGGQTTASLAAAIINDKSRANGLKNIFVPMKLSVVSPQLAVKLIPNIAKYANSQNKVSEADFFSNSPFHIQMEQISRRLLAPAVNGNQYSTYWYYERARGQYNQEMAKMTKTEIKNFKMKYPVKQKFTKTDLAKYYNIYRMLPDQVSCGAQKNFVKFAEWAGEEWKIRPDDFNEAFFKRIIALKIMFQCVDDIVKNAQWYSLGYKGQINVYALSWFFWLLHKDFPYKEFDFKIIWNTQSVPDTLKEVLEKLAEKTYGFLTRKDRPVINVTEYAKRKDCWESLKKIPVTIETNIEKYLIDESEAKEEKKDAKKQQKLDNSINAMKAVFDYGIPNWKAAYSFAKVNPVLTSNEFSLLENCIKLLERMRVPSEKQCAKMISILNKLRDESYPR